MVTQEIKYFSQGFSCLCLSKNFLLITMIVFRCIFGRVLRAFVVWFGSLFVTPCLGFLSLSISVFLYVFSSLFLSSSYNLSLSDCLSHSLAPIVGVIDRNSDYNTLFKEIQQRNAKTSLPLKKERRQREKKGKILRLVLILLNLHLLPIHKGLGCAADPAKARSCNLGKRVGAYFEWCSYYTDKLL